MLRSQRGAATPSCIQSKHVEVMQGSTCNLLHQAADHTQHQAAPMTSYACTAEQWHKHRQLRLYPSLSDPPLRCDMPSCSL
jgi:hypothetical protein